MSHQPAGHLGHHLHKKEHQISSNDSCISPSSFSWPITIRNQHLQSEESYIFLGQKPFSSVFIKRSCATFYHFLSRADTGGHSIRFSPAWDIFNINVHWQCCKWRLCTALHVLLLPTSFKVQKMWPDQEFRCLSDLVYMRAAQTLDICNLSFLKLQSYLEAAFSKFGSPAPKSCFSCCILIAIVGAIDYRNLNCHLIKC